MDMIQNEHLACNHLFLLPDIHHMLVALGKALRQVGRQDSLGARAVNLRRASVWKLLMCRIIISCMLKC
jgi:hypothetical protein